VRRRKRFDRQEWIEEDDVRLEDDVSEKDRPVLRIRPGRSRRSRRLIRPEDRHHAPEYTPTERLLLLDIWTRSGLPAKEFCRLVTVSPATLRKWRRRVEAEGPLGLLEKKRGAPPGSRLPEPTQRAILLLKQANPDFGCGRIRDVLYRAEGIRVSANAVAKLLKERGYVVEEIRKPVHRDRLRRFERARPNQLWQSDLFTFVLTRENRRLYLVAFLDDHSRFIVSFGVHASSGGALVREVFEAGVASYGPPHEVLTDRGPQYFSWRGKSAFTKLLTRRGIRHIVARPRHPQTLGKIERFWKTLWEECVSSAVFRGIEDARRRIGLFIDHYNFQRTHQGIGGLYPADRFFSSAPQVKEALSRRVEENALDLAKNGVPRKPFYLTGQLGDRPVTLFAEGDRVYLRGEDGRREEVELGGRKREPGVPPEPLAAEGRPPSLPGESPETEERAPGTSPLDAILPSPEEDAAEGAR
jgi:transposase InsO family protein